MNAQSSETSGLSLPSPHVEQRSELQPAPEAAPVAPVSPEQAPLRGQHDPTNSQPGALAPPLTPLPPLPAGPAPVSDAPVPATGSSVTPIVADDNDLIEKEWVNKAKEIVERTRQNPYQQSQELNLFKADYMKKRYNKTLKLSE